MMLSAIYAYRFSANGPKIGCTPPSVAVIRPDKNKEEAHPTERCRRLGNLLKEFKIMYLRLPCCVIMRNSRWRQFDCKQGPTSKSPNYVPVTQGKGRMRESAQRSIWKGLDIDFNLGLWCTGAFLCQSRMVACGCVLATEL
jgi:hypothetical protein